MLSCFLSWAYLPIKLTKLHIFIRIRKSTIFNALSISPEGLPRTSVRGSFWLTFLILTVLDLNHFSGLDRPRDLSPDCPQGLADQLGHRLHIVGLEVARQR